ncbi:uncharacterized protein LOC144605357 [Rhinoraja longicauda]
MDSITSVGSYTHDTNRVSGHNDEVWNFLSVEERESLMFLEKTIDSLYIEEFEQTETVITRNGSQSENVPPPYPECPPFAEPAGRIPRAALPLGPSTPDTTPAQVGESKSGSNTLPKASGRGGAESGHLEPSLGEGRRRSFTTPAHPSVGARDERGKHGPPTAPKPGRLPHNIVLRSYHQNNELAPHRQSIYNVPQDSGRGNGPSKDGSTETEAQQARMQALAKLGLLSETDGMRRKRPELVKVPGGRLETGGDEKIASQQEADIEQNKPHGPRGPRVGSGSDANHSTANIGLGNANSLHWQHPSSTSAGLKRLSIPGGTSFPSARYTSTNTSLVAGTSKTLPSVKRSVIVGDGHVRNSSLSPWPLGPSKASSLPPWLLGPSKASSLKRFGTSGDNSQMPGQLRTITVNAPGPIKLPKPRPMSVCSEADLSARHGNTVEGTSPEKPAGRYLPIKIHHISAKPQRSPPKGLNVQSVPQESSSKDRKEALRKLGLLKE